MLTIKGIYGREMYETWYQMSVMIESGLDISPVITHRFSYRDFEEAFAVARSGQSGKVILDWTDDGLARVRERSRRRARPRRLAGLREAGTYKSELVITTPQGAHVEVEGRGELLNLCANNYLGLANHPAVVAAARDALDRWGYGMASVRFICGTQALHASSRSGSRRSSAPRTRSSSPRASTPTAASSRRCSPTRTP